MKAWQPLWLKISRAARGIFRDLFAEADPDENTAPTSGSLAAKSIQLGLIQSQLDALVPELTRLEARRKQSEAERAQLAADISALDSEVDRALLRGDEAQARRLTQRRLELAKRSENLLQRCQEQALIATQASGVLERMRKRWDAAHRQLDDLSAREQDALTLENLADMRRELDAALANLEPGEEKSLR
jgi:phage shock protein A